MRYVEYVLNEKLSFKDVCKIVTMYADEYEVDYFSFHSEAMKREVHNFNCELKTKDGEAAITIERDTIKFYDALGVKESLIQYERICKLLGIEVK